MTKRKSIIDSSSDRDSNCDSPELRCTANARERARMQVLSRGFVKLKTCLPWVPSDTKLSKLDTLRLASCYIAHLKKVLQEADNGYVHHNVKFHPQNLSWPLISAGGKLHIPKPLELQTINLAPKRKNRPKEKCQQLY